MVVNYQTYIAMKKVIYQVATQVRMALLGGIVLAVGSSLALNLWAEGGKPRGSVNVVVDETPIDREGSNLTSFAPVAREVSKGVVNVFATIEGETVEIGSSYGRDPLSRLFGMNPYGGTRRYQTPDRTGMGSGVIVSDDGYILTNNHVIDEADVVKVALNPDGKEYEAEIVGRDPKTDIAVLKIDAGDLSPLRLTNSDGVEVGDIVLAIGNPFGVGQSLTMGIVSAKGRSSGGLQYEDFIQTDAAINRGNSGGALVDAKGRLIGINTMIVSGSGGSQGVGYAIPVNLARNVMEELIEDGRVRRGYLGVMLRDLTPEYASFFEVENDEGVLVEHVARDGAAEDAGVRNGDVIVEFNGEKVDSSKKLRFLVAEADPGDEIELKVKRRGKMKSIEVRLDEFPDEAGLASGLGVRESDDDGVLDGVTVDDLDRQSRRTLNLPSSIDGALVVDVEQGSASEDAGIRVGDVILELNRRPVSSASDAVELSEEIDGGRVMVTVWRNGRTTYVLVEE